MDPIVIGAVTLSILVLFLSLWWLFTVTQSSERPQMAPKGKDDRPTLQSDSDPDALPGDRFETYEELQTGLRQAGLESSSLVIGIDFTKSNLSQGTRTFGGLSLHACTKMAGRNILNPYQQVISIIGRSLEPFDDDNLIPVFGFGEIAALLRPFSHSVMQEMYKLEIKQLFL